MDFGSDSEKGHTPVRSKISDLEQNTKEKHNILIKEAYNTVDGFNSTYKKNLENDKFGMGGQTYDNEVEWNEQADDTFDDDSADIDDSLFLDEVAVSQRAINSSFINIKRNQPLEYKLKNFYK